MILVTHAIVGTALSHKLNGYLAIIITAFASHYILDMIPHWHYNSPAIKKASKNISASIPFKIDRPILREMSRVFADFCLGIALSFYLFDGQKDVILLASISSMSPDLLIGLARLYPHHLLLWHSRFHRRVHAIRDLDGGAILGIGSQAAIAAFFISFF